MIRVLQENLNTALNVVKASIPERYSTLPILKNVLIDTNEGIVNLTTSDLETVVRYQIGCKVETPLAFTVPCKFLAELVNLLPNDVINITHENHTAIFKCGRYTANLNTMDAADYPPLPATEGQEFEIYDLPDAIKKVRDLIENERHGYSATDGLLFDMGLCQVVATDLNHMKVAHINATPIEGLKFRISKKAAIMLLKCKDTVNVTCQPGNHGNWDSRIKFVSGNMTLITQNLESKGQYPDYMKVVTDETYKDKVKVF